MLRYIERRLARQTEPLAKVLCDLPGLAGISTAAGPMAGRRMPRGRDAARAADHDFPSHRRKARHRDSCLAARRGLVPAGHGFLFGRRATARPAIVLSADGQLSMNDPARFKMAVVLAEDGYVVCVAEHASAQAVGQRQIDNINSFYGIGDMVALPPLALRVWDDLRAVQYLAGREDIDRRRIALIGLGVGGIDAAIAAALDGRVAAVAAVGATTVGDWAKEVAPKSGSVRPHLSRAAQHGAATDLQYIYSAVAPRPLLLVEGGRRRRVAAGRVRARPEDGRTGRTSCTTPLFRSKLQGREQAAVWKRSAVG